MSVVAQTGERDVKLTLTSNGQPRAYRVFVPDGFGTDRRPVRRSCCYNGSGSSVDGLMDPWKEIARKDGVILIGPDAFQSGAWRIPAGLSRFHRRGRRGRQGKVPDRSAPRVSLRSFRRRRPRAAARPARVRVLRGRRRARRRVTPGRSTTAGCAATQDPDGDLGGHEGSDGAAQDGARHPRGADRPRLPGEDVRDARAHAFVCRARAGSHRGRMGISSQGNR